MHDEYEVSIEGLSAAGAAITSLTASVEALESAIRRSASRWSRSVWQPNW